MSENRGGNEPITVYHQPPGGESYLDQYRRVADFAALGLPPLSQVSFACADTSLHELHLEPAGKVRLVRFNYTVHLEGLS